MSDSERKNDRQHAAPLTLNSKNFDRVQNSSFGSFRSPQPPFGLPPRKYEVTLAGLFSAIVLLSVTDLVTTSIALREGLREGNIFLLRVASSLNLGFFQTITITKLGFIGGAGLLVYLGISSEEMATRKLVMRSMIVFAVLLFLVSLNNLILISF